ncbi:RCC1 domain-containing protein 1 isoform X2 [Haematobia irritans]|uniref:RCC1 domain-containing protein 1 isoform X2 n=1 Tax=Haematobia irritans TaxID=7368 RepID=UPI003F4F48B0
MYPKLYTRRSILKIINYFDMPNGGGERYYDRLATAEQKHNKTWVVSGYNGFGQLDPSKRQVFRKFEESQIPHISSSSLLSCSWSFLAAAVGCTIHLQGFVSAGYNNVKTIEIESAVKFLASCDRYCLILLENGKLYKCFPQSKQPTLYEVRFQRNEGLIHHSRPLNEDSGTKISSVACGNAFMVALGESNEVFSGTTQIHQFPNNVRVKQLECGFEHALMLTHNGDLYTWGNGLRGQLGNEMLKIEEMPVLIEALAGIKITNIAASGWHSAAISSFGDLYTWGFNSNGQLGITPLNYESSVLKVYSLPQLVNIVCHTCEGNESEEHCFPVKVAAGARHTVLILNCGSVLATGWNAYGQAGTDDPKNCDNFVNKMIIDQNIENIELKCGSWCTFIGICDNGAERHN